MVNLALKISEALASGTVKRLTRSALLATFLSMSGVTVAYAHPLHTTLTQVSIDPRRGGAIIVVRAFIDDFGAAAARLSGVAQAPDHSVPEAALRTYVAAKLSLVDAQNQRVPFTWEGVRREGDVVWLTLRAPALKSLRGVRLGTAVLFEKFEDQVNIVQVDDGDSHRSMLFTRSDAGKVKTLL